MAQWKRKLNLKEDWKLAKGGAITPQELGQRIATKLKKLSEQDDLFYIICDFEALDADSTFDDFDDIMAALYDWGDETLDSSHWPPVKQCWIATF